MVELVPDNNAQMMRLYAAAKALRGAETKADVARLLNVSSQNIYAWEERGISSEGLLLAQENIGCNAIWLRDGTGEMIGCAEDVGTFLQGFGELTTLFAKAKGKYRTMILDAARAVIDVQESNKGRD